MAGLCIARKPRHLFRTWCLT